MSVKEFITLWKAEHEGEITSHSITVRLRTVPDKIDEAALEFESKAVSVSYAVYKRGDYWTDLIVFDNFNKKTVFLREHARATIEDVAQELADLKVKLYNGTLAPE
jgi:hypothetical protein